MKHNLKLQMMKHNLINQIINIKGIIDDSLVPRTVNIILVLLEFRKQQRTDQRNKDARPQKQDGGHI